MYRCTLLQTHWRLFLTSLSIVLVLACFQGAQSAPKQATDTRTVEGQFFAHDVFERYMDGQELGRGFRTYNPNNTMTRLFTYPISTPLNLEVATNGSYRLYSDTFDGGFGGSIGLAGGLTVFSLESAPNADPQIPDGFASLQLSVRQGSGMNDSAFDGSYSYHALLRDDDGTYRTSFGAANANGGGAYFLIRESAIVRTFSYDVESDGRIDLGPQEPNFAAVVPGGDVVVNTATYDHGDDPEAPDGYTGLALYLRRFPDNDATYAEFRGTYRIHQLSSDGSTTPRSEAGTITAGGGGYFFGTLDGLDYSGQIQLNTTGTFTLVDSTAYQGTLSAAGDIAVLTTTGSTTPTLTIWVRTAGGPGNALDEDGDGVPDHEEGPLGTDIDNPDTDGDGLLDNTDARPTIADNVVDATLSESQVVFEPDGTTSAELTLTLDSDDFPFFDWALSSNVSWLTLERSEGFGDETITVRINAANLSIEDSPYVATIDLIAPNMAPVAPLSLTVAIATTQVDLIVSPESLSLSVIEGGPVVSAPVSLSSPDGEDFSWESDEVPTWLTLTPPEGSGPTEVTLAVDPTDLLVTNTPYTTTITFRPGGSGTKSATVALTVDVLPPREIDVPFPLSPGENGQTDPAVAFDAPTGQWLVTWVEAEAIWLLILDEALLPFGAPVQLSGDFFGIADNPAIVLVDDAREAWVVWEQRQSPTDDAILQVRPIDLTDRSLGNRFGFTTASGDKSAPSATYNAETDEVLVTYDLAFGEQAFVGQARIDGTTREERSTGFAAANDHHQSAPVVAWLADSNRYLVVWHEIIPGEEADVLQVRAARLDGDTGDIVGEILVIDEDAPNAAHLRVNAATGLGSWTVTWSEASLTSLPARLQSRSVTSDGLVGTRYMTDTTQRAIPPVELAFNPASRLGTLLWTRARTDGDDVAVYQYTSGQGQPLGDPVSLPDMPRSASSGAVGANPTDNEFLLVWEDPETIPRQLRALRIAGGSDDVDGDGLPNEWELAFGLNPNSDVGDDGALGDPDKDGLSNLAEFMLGTDPTDPDGDDDGLLDGQEDTNSDGMITDAETSPLNPDSDDDGVTDNVEWFLGSDGADPNDQPESGIFQIDYGTWTPGESGILTVGVYLAEATSVALQVNPDGARKQVAGEDWTLSSEDDGDFLLRDAGVHEITYELTPSSDVTATTAYGTFRFVLQEDEAVLDSRTTVLVADPLSAYEGDSPSAQSLAEAYAPVLRLHRDAVFAPIPVEVSLDTAQFDVGNTMTLRVAPRAIDLYQSPYVEAQVDLPGEDTEALFAAYPEAEVRPAPTLYYTVAALDKENDPPRQLAIQYYLHFYADVWGLDQPGGHRHEGDWEVFQVLINDGLPFQATATQQGQLAVIDGEVAGGESRPWEAIEVTPASRPVVYVAQGSHALYFEPGATTYEAGLDIRDGLGYWLLPEGAGGLLSDTDYPKTLPVSLTPLNRAQSDQAPRWLRFAGRWGQWNYPVPDSDHPDPTVDDGPLGPLFLGTTTDPQDDSGIQRIWSDPLAFATRMPDNTDSRESEIRVLLPESVWGDTALLLDARGRIFSATIAVEDGSVAITAPVQPYLLAVVDWPAGSRPTLRAMARFTLFDTSTPIFQATEGITNLGTLTFEDGFLVGVGNYGLQDTDGDSVSDHLDPDIDGDGKLNTDDDDLLNDGWSDTYHAQDPDGDGVPNFLDDDDDGDDLIDALDPDRDGNGVDDGDDPGDRDGDGFLDAVDLDQDNDGFTDGAERAAGSDPLHYLDTPLQQVGDLDGDGDVDAADGQQLVNQALGRAPYDARLDYNLNGAIDAVDLQLLIEDILAP